MSNKYLRHSQVMQKKLIPGEVDSNHFELLVTIAGVRNKRMLYALRDVLVKGQSRKVSCGEHCVSQGYLSIKIRKLQSISDLVSDAYIYYL